VPLIIALILVVISGLVAAAGDYMGQRAARRKVRIGTLRPRYVSRLIAVCSGIVISLATYGAMFLLYTDFRKAVTEYDETVARYNKAVADRDAAESQLKGMQDDLKAADEKVAAANKSVEEANRSITELQNSKIALVKEADDKRKEVAQLSAQKAQADRDLKSTNKELSSARSDLNKVRSDLRGSQALSAMKLDQLRSGDIILPKGTVLARVEIPAARAGDVIALTDAALDGVKLRLASELGAVLSADSHAALEQFALRYPYASPASDAIVVIQVKSNVFSKDSVPVEFIAVGVEKLLRAGELLLTLRIGDTGARITARGQTTHDVSYEQFDGKALENTLVRAADDYVSAMLALGFNPPSGMDDADLAAPVLQIAEMGGELLARERPYVIQVATKSDLTSAQWPSDVTLNVFKEPGS
jgi:hypothetical protein